MTAAEIKYIDETNGLIQYFEGKQSRMKSYIATCHTYIQELRSSDPVKMQSKIENDQLFIQLLSFVEESFRPDHFISCCSYDYIEVFDADFMNYILYSRKQIKKPLKWKMLCDLDYKFSILRIQFLIKSGFTLDFTDFAIKNIKIIDLWNLSTD